VRTARSAGFIVFCVIVMAAIVVPSVRAQRRAPVDWHARDVRTVAQQKINPGVLSAIYQRRGDRRAHPAAAGQVQVDRHGRAYDSIIGWVPLAMLERLAADPSVRGIEPAH